jgi:Fe-S cluster biosynthesis and repair protein YggX
MHQARQEAEGLDFPPYPGDLGKRIWESVSKQAWADWLKHQTMLVNENRLNLADLRARQYLARQMENHFFGGGADAAGIRPANALTGRSLWPDGARAHAMAGAGRGYRPGRQGRQSPLAT